MKQSSLERHLRKVLHSHGYSLRKDRLRVKTFDHQGGYMVVDVDRNWIVAGEKFDLTLDDLRRWVTLELLTEDKKIGKEIASLYQQRQAGGA